MYPEFTYQERNALDKDNLPIDYQCEQTDSVQGFPAGYYIIVDNGGENEWSYVGTRPIKR